MRPVDQGPPGPTRRSYVGSGASLAPEKGKGKGMSELKDQMNRFYKEVFENRNLDAIDDMVAPDFVEHETPPPGMELAPGLEGAKQMLGAYLAAFDPFTVQVHDQFEDGDTVITRATFTATHVGEFGGIPATNKQISMDLIDIVKFRDGKATDHWGQSDGIAMLDQMGVLPPMG